MSKSVTLPEEDPEEGYTMEDILRARGYSEEYLAERRLRIQRQYLDTGGEAGTT